MVLFPHPPEAEIAECVARTHRVIDERLIDLEYMQAEVESTPSQKGRHSDPLRAVKRKASNKNQQIEVRAPVTDMTVPKRHVTKEEREAWHIPPCVSNYVNPKGHIVPLEVRSLSTRSAPLLPSGKHEQMSDHVQKVAAEVQTKIQTLERETQEKAEMETAMEEQRLRDLMQRNQENRRNQLRAMESTETEEERTQRQQRERALLEHRREIHRQELRKEKVRERLGISDVELERDLSDAMALEQDGIVGAAQNPSETFFDERLTSLTRGEIEDGEVSGESFIRGQPNTYALNRSKIAGEFERLLASDHAKDTELVFEKEDGDDPFAALDEHLQGKP